MWRFRVGSVAASVIYFILCAEFFVDGVDGDQSSRSQSEVCTQGDATAACTSGVPKAAFGHAAIMEHSLFSSESEDGFTMYVRFRISVSDSFPYLTEAARGLVFTNSNFGGQCDGAGLCAIDIVRLPAGFYETRVVVVDSSVLSDPKEALCADYLQCEGVLSFRSDKINFFEVTLLSTVVDPFSPMLDVQISDRSGRPASLVTENDYEVNDEGDILSVPLLTDGGQCVTFVSPLVPRPSEIETIMSCSWTCIFDGFSVSVEGAVSSDGQHTFRVSCPVPSPLLSSVQARRWVHVEFFRDGVAVAPKINDHGFRKAVMPPPPAEQAAAPIAVEVCTMVRNEEPFIVEWVEYHLMLGVSHIHVYLHLTTDNTVLLLEPYILRGLVTTRAWDFNWSPMYMRFQSHAWNDCSIRRGASSLPVWLSILDVDEFLVPASSRDPVLAGASYHHDADVAAEYDDSLPHVLAAMAAERGVEEVSAFKMAWLPFSSTEEVEVGTDAEMAGDGASGPRLSIARFRWHGAAFEPEVGKMIGDQQHGKVVIRADHGVHLDFAGHKATVAPHGMAEADPSNHIFIAHYIGRPRSYALPDARHEEEARRRRAVAEEGASVRWLRSPLCRLAKRLRRHVCSRDPAEFPAAAALCAGERGQEEVERRARECEGSGVEGRFR
mmetsp:Transcript_51994/g.105935  ORF Transcript_51994/g.105935 Transcript_51994/m.105935 type:complete len:664 (+) Transcript_51994:360-2351(+)